jgi:hypothetical protein
MKSEGMQPEVCSIKWEEGQVLERSTAGGMPFESNLPKIV